MIPTLDLRDWAHDRRRFVAELGRGLEEFGFLAIEGHAIEAAVLERCYTVIRAFFDLPLEEKLRHEIAGGAGQRGYTRVGVETARNAAVADRKEFWHVGREDPPDDVDASIFPRNLWPSEPPGFRPLMRDLYDRLEELGGILLRAIALHLQQPEDFFVAHVRGGNSILRPIHYPPVQVGDAGVRSAAHEDINLITLLVGAEEPGLEIRTRRGEWLPVVSTEGAVVMNVGDMLQRWSNDVLPSTTHRVVNPRGAAALRSRYSVPFFLHPHPHCRLDPLASCVRPDRPLRYTASITAHEYLMQRLREIGLA